MTQFKKNAIHFVIASFTTLTLSSQNYLDRYLTDSLTFTTIVNSTQQVDSPRDLDFKPNTNELWVGNRGTSAGGTNVIVYDAGTASQTSEYRKDSHSSHFFVYPSAFAFSEIGQWAGVSEIQNTNAASATFMGPALWNSDTAVFARVHQNNWVSGFPLGSHYDMLHQSPFAMGIAHDSAKAYWVADGYNGNIVLYDFVEDHGPGYDDHSAGVIYRYTDVPFSRTVNIPGHMILDHATGWLYYIDSGTKRLRRMDTNTGTNVGPLTVPTTANEPLARYWQITGATQETIDTFQTQICGIDIYNGRMIVGDYTNGNIYVYDVTGPSPVFMDTIVTGQAGMEGIKIGPDGKIWFVNFTSSEVVRIDASLSLNDASIQSIVSPITNNYLQSFYSIEFNYCTNSIAPSVLLTNSGSNVLDSVTINYTIDNGPINTYLWIGSLASGSNTIVTLPTINIAQGERLLTAFTSSPNGTTDTNPANDKKEGSFRTHSPLFPVPFSEGFSTNAFPTPGWSYVGYNPHNKMSRDTSNGGFGNSSECIKMDNYNRSKNISGQKDYLMTPEIDMSNATSGTTFDFTVAYAQSAVSSTDRLLVLASINCGSTWSIIYDKNGDSLKTRAPQWQIYASPLATEWRRESVGLNAYLGQSSVIFMFESESDYGNNIYIDDILVDNTTAIAEQENSNEVRLFPNPTTGFFTVETNLSGAETAQIIVTNMLGETMSVTAVSGAEHGLYTLDMSPYPVGTYFVTVNSDTKASVTQKISVNR